MKNSLFFLIIFILSGNSFCYSQNTKSIIHPEKNKVSGTEFELCIPENFEKSKLHQDEYVYSEQGTVIRFAYLQDVSHSEFLDSMTTRYFETQQLREVTETKSEGRTIFRGKFSINEIPYLRTFYIIPYKGGTILGIANYPERLGEELENQFMNMIKKDEDE